MSATVRAIDVAERVDGVEHVHRDRPDLDVEREGHARVGRQRARSASPTVARNGRCRRPVARDRLDRGPVPARPLDADRRDRSELDLDAVIGGERLRDDLALHLAVERQEQLLAGVVLAQVDERVLLGQLGQRGEERRLVARVAGARPPSRASAARTRGAARVAGGSTEAVADARAA